MGMSTLNTNESEFPSENDDPWDVDTDTEEEEDEIQDDGLLTMLVRKSYLKHLERCLKKNYEDSLIKEEVPPAELNEFISFHAKFLEKRALRSSMRVGIYQRYMVKAIDEIKQATKKNRIHQTFTRRRPKKKEKIEKETQTEQLPKPEEKTEMQNMLSSAFGFSPGASGVHAGIDSYEELLNILTSSPNLVNHSISDHCDASQDVTFNSVPIGGETPKRRMNLDERLQLLGFLGDDDDDTVGIPTTIHSAIPTLPPALQDPFIDQDSTEEPASKICRRAELPSDWSQEVVRQTELMMMILERKSPFMRALIERRFKDLFGVDVDRACVPETAPVVDQEDSAFQDELLLARRNVAGHVVKALTPYYVQGRIGSRLIFKSLAKRVTDRLLSKTLTPDPKEAKKEVKICFALQSEILSTKDIDKVFSTLGY